MLSYGTRFHNCHGYKWSLVCEAKTVTNTHKLYCIVKWRGIDPRIIKLLNSQCNSTYREQVKRALQWRHNGRNGVSNHQPHDCLLNRLFRRRSKKPSKLRVTGLCAGNSPGPVNSPHKWPVTRKMSPFDDVIMVLSWNWQPFIVFNSHTSQGTSFVNDCGNYLPANRALHKVDKFGTKVCYSTASYGNINEFMKM